MANNKHLLMLQQDVDKWDDWRQRNPAIRPNLSRANLCGANLTGANLSYANLTEAALIDANLTGADLRKVTLRRATLIQADFSNADLRRADFSNADLRRANFIQADLTGANLTAADLRRATLVDTNLCDTTLTNCSIYGINVWNIQLDRATQRDLIITPADEPVITVDNLEIAQFIYLLLNNQKIREVIDTVAKKAVLILGRFTPERMAILDAIREAIRQKNYIPILFDFEKPTTHELTETVSTLAHLSHFIIADLTDPSCIPHELYAIVPEHKVPIIPLFHPTQQGSHEYAMFRDLKRGRAWVLPIHHYTTLENLLATLQSHIIEPAEKKARELITLKNSPDE